MRAYKNLILIGTSHIARESMNEVRSIILDKKPGVVAVELDAKRLSGLLDKNASGSISPRHIGLSGWVFAKIGQYIQKKLGNIVNLDPGSEMLCAVKSAKKVDAKLALIDQDITVTLKNIRFKWSDMKNFLADFVLGIVSPRKEMEKLGLKDLDLKKVPDKELVEKLIARIRDRYPYLYKVLISDRNRVMARKLYRIMNENDGLIIAVVGAGHEQGIITNLERLFGSKAEISYRLCIN